MDRYSFLFKVDYRTKSGLHTRNVYIVAETLGEAAQAALAKAHTWRGVIKVDSATSVGRPIQCSGGGPTFGAPQ
jgi:hypothetical protein